MLRYEADVEVDGAPDPVEPGSVQHPVDDLPDEVLPFTLPSRYVFGYLPDIGVQPHEHPMDFCAWMEVFLGGRWSTSTPATTTPCPGPGGC